MKETTSGALRFPHGLGCMTMADPPAAGTDPADAVIGRALHLGVTFVDTAELDGSDHNEEIVEQALRRRRDEAVLATKCGVRRLADGDVEYRVTLRRSAPRASRPGRPDRGECGVVAELVAEGRVRHLGLSEVCPGCSSAARSEA